MAPRHLRVNLPGAPRRHGALGLGRMARSLGLLGAVGLGLGGFAAPARGGPATTTALLLSDIHFDPFADPTQVKALARARVRDWPALLRAHPGNAPAYGQDCDARLWNFTLEAVGRTGGHYAYALILGDMLAHGFDAKCRRWLPGGRNSETAFALKVLDYVADSLSRRLPGVPLYWVLGNNDSDQGDYELAPNSQLLRGLLADPAWADEIRGREAQRDFKEAGYYATDLPGQAGPLLVLNDVFWSARRDPDASTARESVRELDWLAKRLEQASRAGQRVTVAMHIPPGMDPYPVLKGHGAEPFLRPDANRALLALLAAHAGAIRWLWAGHTHNDEWRVLPGTRENLALHLVPSVSPVHGNRPCYQVLSSSEADASPRDLATYCLPLAGPAVWRLEYRFQAAYGLPFGPAGMFKAVAEVAQGGPARLRYQNAYAGGRAVAWPRAAEFWAACRCAQRHPDETDYRRCLRRSLALNARPRS